MKTKQIATAIVLFLMVGIMSCKKDNTPEPELLQPTIDNMEIGLNNNEIGIIGKDFHFNADLVAGEKIESVQIKIVPQPTETYSKSWKMELTWAEFKGMRNANVHKHFTIPEDAAEGKYDFIILVKDQNGAQLEVTKKITLYTEVNLPANPKVFLFTAMADKRVIYDLANGGFLDPVTQKYGNGPGTIAKGDNLMPAMTITGIEGNGQMYVVLINKKLNYRPETIDALDFSKVIVVDIYDHENVKKNSSFTNSTIRRPVRPKLLIGATEDNNIPAKPISGLKTWESGTYYLGVIYKNSSHNIGTFKYIEINVNMN